MPTRRTKLIGRLLETPVSMSLDPRFVTLWEQRERSQNAGNMALAAELSAEILSLVEQRAKAVADDAKLRDNEQIKYTCTFVNAMAASVFTAGIATPVIGLFAPGSPYATEPHLLVRISTGCFVVAVALHMVVRAMPSEAESMTMSPTTVLLLLGGNVIALGLFIYILSELAAFRSRITMAEMSRMVDRERATTRRLLEEQRQNSSIYASPPAA